MLIRSKIERKGGTTVTIAERTYEFVPQEPGAPHICNVEDEADIARFLSIPEGYEVVREAKAPKAAAPAPASEPEPQPEPEPDDAIEGETDGALFIVLTSPDDATDEQVADAFMALYGRAPNPKAKRETIIQRIAEKAAEQGADADE